MVPKQIEVSIFGVHRGWNILGVPVCSYRPRKFWGSILFAALVRRVVLEVSGDFESSLYWGGGGRGCMQANHNSGLVRQSMAWLLRSPEPSSHVVRVCIQTPVLWQDVGRG